MHIDACGLVPDDWSFTYLAALLVMPMLARFGRGFEAHCIESIPYSYASTVGFLFFPAGLSGPCCCLWCFRTLQLESFMPPLLLFTSDTQF